MTMLAPSEGMRQQVIGYASCGFSVIPLRSRDKKPDVSRWQQYQNRRPKQEEIEGWFSGASDRNIGVICGDVSGGLFVLDFDGLDFDNPDAFVYVMGEPPEVLAKTVPVVKTHGGVHVYMRSKDKKAPASKKFRRKDGRGINIDLQAEGKYVVAPPSVHPSGDVYRFIGSARNPPMIDAKNFLKRLELAEEEWPYVSMLLPLWIEGQRNSLVLGFSAFMRKYLNWTEGRAEGVVELICRVKDDPEERSRLLAVEGTYVKEIKEIAVQGEYPYFDEDLFKEMKGLLPKKAKESAGEKRTKNAAKKRKENFELAHTLMVEFDFLTMKDNEELWVYEDGVWRPEGKIMVKMRVQDAFQDQATIHRTREVIGHIKRDGSTLVWRDIFNSEDHLANLENGVIDLSQNPPQLLEHDPEFHFTYKLPVLFNPDSECPKIEKFFQDVLKPEDVETMEEWFGYHLLRSYLYSRLQIWYGAGRNGKTKMKMLLEAFLGEGNVTNISIQELNEDKFVRADLYGKLGNICGDLPDRPLRYTGIVKQLTGQDRMMAQRKHQDPFYFTNFAKCTFAGNELPEISDRTLAWWERLDIIEFLVTFLDGDPKTDPDILEKLTTEEELSGLLNLALRGLQRLLKRKGFKRSRTSDETKMSYLRISAPTLAFMQDCVKADDDGEIEKEEFYQGYCFYCRKNRVRPGPEATGVFTGKVKLYASDIGAYVTLGRASYKPRPRVWKGISWKDNPLKSTEGKQKTLRDEDEE